MKSVREPQLSEWGKRFVALQLVYSFVLLTTKIGSPTDRQRVTLTAVVVLVVVAVLVTFGEYLPRSKSTVFWITRIAVSGALMTIGCWMARFQVGPLDTLEMSSLLAFATFVFVKDLLETYISTFLHRLSDVSESAIDQSVGLVGHGIAIVGGVIGIVSHPACQALFISGIVSLVIPIPILVTCGRTVTTVSTVLSTTCFE